MVRDDRQAEEGRGDQDADDDDGHRRAEVGGGADPDGDRLHAGTHRNGGHEGRPGTLAAGAEQGVAAVEAGVAAGEDEVVDEMASGRLVEVLSSCRAAAEPISAVHPSGRLVPPRVRVAIDALLTLGNASTGVSAEPGE